MAERHKWADVAIAFAEGKAIQFRNGLTSGWADWLVHDFPPFLEFSEWRVKPEPKPDIVRTYLLLTWDSETGALKSAEVIE